MKTIIHAVQIHARPEKVFDAITTEKGVTGWWSTKATADMRVGGVIDFTFLEGFNPDMQITTLDKPALVGWKCVGGHDYWKNNTFRFAIEERDGDSLLMFTQEYAKELSDEKYGEYNFNWGYYLQSLKKYCETGTGTPFRSE